MEKFQKFKVSTDERGKTICLPTLPGRRLVIQGIIYISLYENACDIINSNFHFTAVLRCCFLYSCLSKHISCSLIVFVYGNRP